MNQTEIWEILILSYKQEEKKLFYGHRLVELNACFFSLSLFLSYYSRFIVAYYLKFLACTWDYYTYIYILLRSMLDLIKQSRVNIGRRREEREKRRNWLKKIKREITPLVVIDGNFLSLSLSYLIVCSFGCNYNRKEGRLWVAIELTQIDWHKYIDNATN